ncbi:VanW family protein [Salipaludibacillus daqingensis]|uniref:VanW family protein n=1 Tax=Salipaludibacillus daqingensis TaxID=3041001 RepID=UPI0024755757|nr:VanW family protein [Salipaludibacillus daqingensis]
MTQVCMIILILLAQAVDLPDSLEVTLQGETLAIVNRDDFTNSLLDTLLIDREKTDHFIEKLDQQIHRDPVNAMINDDGETVQGQVGYKLDQEAFMEDFYAYIFGNGSGKIEVSVLDIYPEVDSELLAHIRVQPIGEYVTYYNSNNKNRSHNISLASEAMDNHVVFPNETFSFNRAVGERTLAKGYVSAPVIVKGEFSEGVGGGICQVSSTLFNAVDHAGLKIVQRFSHSRRVPYVPPGRDATVSWYGPDFTFQNNYNQPILIRTKGSNGSMSVTLYSSDVINYQPRKVPEASPRLPKEINSDL